MDWQTLLTAFAGALGGTATTLLAGKYASFNKKREIGYARRQDIIETLLSKLTAIKTKWEALFFQRLAATGQNEVDVETTEKLALLETEVRALIEEFHLYSNSKSIYFVESFRVTLKELNEALSDEVLRQHTAFERFEFEDDDINKPRQIAFFTEGEVQGLMMQIEKELNRMVD